MQNNMFSNEEMAIRNFVNIIDSAIDKVSSSADKDIYDESIADFVDIFSNMADRIGNYIIDRNNADKNNAEEMAAIDEEMEHLQRFFEYFGDYLADQTGRIAETNLPKLRKGLASISGFLGKSRQTGIDKDPLHVITPGKRNAGGSYSSELSRLQGALARSASIVEDHIEQIQREAYKEVRGVVEGYAGNNTLGDFQDYINDEKTRDGLRKNGLSDENIDEILNKALNYKKWTVKKDLQTRIAQSRGSIKSKDDLEKLIGDFAKEQGVDFEDLMKMTMHSKKLGEDFKLSDFLKSTTRSVIGAQAREAASGISDFSELAKRKKELVANIETAYGFTPEDMDSIKEFIDETFDRVQDKLIRKGVRRSVDGFDVSQITSKMFDKIRGKMASKIIASFSQSGPIDSDAINKIRDVVNEITQDVLEARFRGLSSHEFYRLAKIDNGAYSVLDNERQEGLKALHPTITTSNQAKPNIKEIYNIDEFLNRLPENIKNGSHILERLKTLWADSGMSEDEIKEYAGGDSQNLSNLLHQVVEAIKSKGLTYKIGMDEQTGESHMAIYRPEDESKYKKVDAAGNEYFDYRSAPNIPLSYKGAIEDTNGVLMDVNGIKYSNDLIATEVNGNLKLVTAMEAMLINVVDRLSKFSGDLTTENVKSAVSYGVRDVLEGTSFVSNINDEAKAAVSKSGIEWGGMGVNQDTMSLVAGRLSADRLFAQKFKEFKARAKKRGANYGRGKNDAEREQNFAEDMWDIVQAYSQGFGIDETNENYKYILEDSELKDLAQQMAKMPMFQYLASVGQRSGRMFQVGGMIQEWYTKLGQNSGKHAAQGAQAVKLSDEAKTARDEYKNTTGQRNRLYLNTVDKNYDKDSADETLYNVVGMTEKDFSDMARDFADQQVKNGEWTREDADRWMAEKMLAGGLNKNMHQMDPRIAKQHYGIRDRYSKVMTPEEWSEYAHSAIMDAGMSPEDVMNLSDDAMNKLVASYLMDGIDFDAASVEREEVDGKIRFKVQESLKTSDFRTNYGMGDRGMTHVSSLVNSDGKNKGKNMDEAFFDMLTEKMRDEARKSGQFSEDQIKKMRIDVLKEASSGKTEDAPGEIAAVIEAYRQLYKNDKEFMTVIRDAEKNNKDKLLSKIIKLDKKGNAYVDSNSDIWKRPDLMKQLVVLLQQMGWMKKKTNVSDPDPDHRVFEFMASTLHRYGDFEWTNDSKYGERERRAVENAGASTKAFTPDADTKKAVDAAVAHELSVLSPDKSSKAYKEAEARKDAIEKDIANTSNVKDVASYTGKSIKIGVGTGNDIDLSTIDDTIKFNFTSDDMENGKIKQEAYDNSIYSVIDKAVAKYRAKNGLKDDEEVEIIVNTPGGFNYMDGRKRNYSGNGVFVTSMMPQQEQSVTGDTFYTQAETQGEMLHLIKDLKEGKSDDDISHRVGQIYTKAFNEATDHKKAIQTETTSVRLPGSVGKAMVGGNMTAADATANDPNADPYLKYVAEQSMYGVTVHTDTARKLLGTNLDELRAQYRHRFGEDAAKNLNAEQLVDELVNSYKRGTDAFNKAFDYGKSVDWKNNLIVRGERVPALEGQDIKYATLNVSDDIDKGVAVLGSKMALSNKTDYDLDHNTFSNVMRDLRSVHDEVNKMTDEERGGLSKDEVFKQKVDEIFAGYEAKVAYFRQIAKMLGDKEMAKNNSGDVGIDAEKLPNNKIGAKIATIVNAMNKGGTGPFSYVNTGVRDLLAKAGWDEKNYDPSNPEQAIVGQIYRTIFNKLEEEGISSKHIRERLEKDNQWKTMFEGKTDEEALSLVDDDTLTKAVTDAMTEIRSIEADVFDRTKNYGVMDMLKDERVRGILLKDGVFDGIQIQRALAQIALMRDAKGNYIGNKWLMDNFGKDLSGDDLQKYLWEYDDHGNLLDANKAGSLPIETLMAIIKRADAMKIGSEGVGLPNARDPEHALTIPQNPFSEARWLDTIGAQGTAIDQLNESMLNGAAAYDYYGQRVNLASEALKKEIELEKYKTRVANAEAKAIRGTGKAYNNMRAVLANAEAGKGDLDKRGSRVTSLAAILAGDSNYEQFTPQNKYLAKIWNTKKFSTYYNDEYRDYEFEDKKGKRVWKRNGKEITDQDEIDFLNRLGMSQGDFERTRQYQAGADRGTAAHAVSQIMTLIAEKYATENPNVHDWGSLATFVKSHGSDQELQKLYDSLMNGDGQHGGIKSIKDYLGLFYGPSADGQKELQQKIDEIFKIGVGYSKEALYNKMPGTHVITESDVAFYDGKGKWHPGHIDTQYVESATGANGEKEANYVILDYKTRSSDTDGIKPHEILQVVGGYGGGERQIIIDIASALASGKITTDLDSLNSFTDITEKYRDAEGNPIQFTQKWFDNVLKFLSTNLGVGDDQDPKRFSKLKKLEYDQKKKLFNHFRFRIREAKPSGITTSEINPNLTGDWINDPIMSVIMEKWNNGLGEGSLTEEEKEFLIKNAVDLVRGQYQQINFATGGSTPPSKYHVKGKKSSGGAPSKTSEFTEASALLHEEYNIKKELASIADDSEEYKVKEGRVAAIKQKLQSIQLSKQETQQLEEQRKKYEEILKYQKAIADAKQKDKDAKRDDKEVARLYKELLGLETDAYKLQQQANTALNQRQRSTYQNLLGMKKQKAEDVQGAIDGLLQNYSQQEVSQMQKEYERKLQMSKAQVDVSLKGQHNFWDVLANDITRSTYALTNFNIAHKVIYRIPQQIKKIIEMTKQLDKVLTNVAIVTGQSRKEAERYLDTYIDLAKQLGATTTQVAQATIEWLRQGYTIQESQKLVTASIQLSKLGMMDASAATSSLTSALKGFKLEASEASSVVDKLVSLDLKYATSAGNIATALSKVSAVARSARMNIDETASMVTVMMDVTQAESGAVGTALQTILSRFGNVKSGAFLDMEENGEGASKSINDIEKVLSPLGIKIRNSTGEMRNFSDVMSELSDRWINLDDVTKNAISTAFAGTRQRNFFNVLVQGYDEVEKAQEIAMNSKGMADIKYKEQLDSVEAAINNITVAWEKFTKKLEANGVIKAFAKTVASLVDNLDHILTFAGSRLAMAAVRNSTGIGSSIRSFGRSTFGFLTGGDMSSKNNTTQAVNSVGQTVNNIYALMRGQTTSGGAVVANKAKNGIGLALGTNTPEYAEKPGVLYNGAKGRVRIRITDANGHVTANRFASNKDFEQLNTNAAYADWTRKPHIASWWRGQSIYQNGQHYRYNPSTSQWIDDNADVVRDKNTADALDSAMNRKSSINSALATGAVVGITSGVMRAMSTDEEYGGEKAVAGGLSALFNGGMTAIGTIVGGPIGGMVGSAIGSALDMLTPTLVGWYQRLFHGQEIARKERAEQAQKNLDALQQMSSAISDGMSLINIGTDEMTSSDWNSWNAMITSFEDAMAPFKDENGDKDVEANAKYVSMFNDKLHEILGTTDDYDDVLAKLSARTGDYEYLYDAWAAAQNDLATQASYAAQEVERYTLAKKIENETDEKLRNAYKAQLDEIEKERREGQIKTAFYSSGTASMSALDVTAANLEGVLIRWAQKYAEENPDNAVFTSSGEINSEFRQIALATLRTNENLNALLSTGESVNIGQYYNGSRGTRANRLSKTFGTSFDELVKVAKTNNFEALAKNINIADDEIERLRDEILNLGAQDMSIFRYALMMTDEELMESADRLRWVGSKQVSGTLDDLIKTFDTLNTALKDLAENGTLSSESISKLMESMPSLFFGSDGSFSQENVIKNVASIAAGGSGVEVATRMAASSAGSDSIAMQAYQEYIKSRKSEDLPKTVQDNIDEIMASQTIDSIWKFMGADDMINEAEWISKMVGEISEKTNYALTIQKKLIEWQTHLYDLEINNIQSLKDAIDDENKSRETAISLAKAREKLENAQNEKKRVYREGIGFTYVSDTEAVQSAQEELDKLERERDKENIQYQLDLLNQQKEILSHIEENTNLKNLENAVENIKTQLATEGNLFTTTTGGLTSAFVADLGKNNALTADDIASAFMNYQQNKLDSVTKGNIDSVKTAYDALISARENIGSSFSKESYEANVGTYNSAYDDYINAMAKLKSDTNFDQYYKSNKDGIDWLNSIGNDIGSKIDLSESMAPIDYRDIAKNGNIVRQYVGLQYFDKEDVPYNDYARDDDVYGENGRYFGRYVGTSYNGQLIMENDHTGYTESVLTNNGFVDKDNIVSWQKDLLLNHWYKNNNTGYYFYYDGLPDMRELPADQWIGLIKNSVEYNKKLSEIGTAYSSGTFSSQQGPSIINELGLEGIITPRGTLTSLPARTGIIPADLTRNLYNLGEVAPNLIRNLESHFEFDKNTTGSTEDNSTNINTLHAEFVVDEGFDFDQFLIKVRQVVDTTKNNR